MAAAVRSRSAASTRPRDCRVDPSNPGCPRPGRRPTRPELANRHHERKGHPSHRGAVRQCSRPRSNHLGPGGRATCPPRSTTWPPPPRPARRRSPPSPRSCGRWYRPLRREPRTRSRRLLRPCTGQPRAASNGRHDPPAPDRRDRQRSPGPHAAARPPAGCSQDQPKPAPLQPGMRRRAMPGSGTGRGTPSRSARPAPPASAGASPPTRERPTGLGSGRGATRTRGAAAGTTREALPGPHRAGYASRRRRSQWSLFET